MAIVYDPKVMLKKIAPEKKIKRLLSEGVTLKKAALSFVDDIDFINKKSVKDLALKTIKEYKKRIRLDESVKSEILEDPKQLINRVQGLVVFQVAKEIRSKYGDEMAEWLPSDAEEPDPEHQLNYGKKFLLSEGINGEIPGERIGCKCGIRILVKQTELELD